MRSRIGVVLVADKKQFYEVIPKHTLTVVKINILKVGQEKIEHPIMKPSPGF